LNQPNRTGISFLVYANKLEYLISDVTFGVVLVCSAVLAQDRVTLEMLVRTAPGYTDANGFVALNCYISWDYDPDLIDMMAYVSSSGYTTIQCSGNYTTTGNTLYPEFEEIITISDILFTLIFPTYFREKT